MWRKGTLGAFLSYAKTLGRLYYVSIKTKEKKIETNFIDDSNPIDLANFNVFNFFTNTNVNVNDNMDAEVI